MKLTKTLSAGVAAIALSTAFATIVATPVLAQQTTSDIRGVVTDESGAPLAGASVTIVDANTGTTRRATTDSAGRFSAQNLSVSGDYTVSASRAGYQGEGVEGVRLSLGDTTFITLDLASGSGDEIIVMATRSSTIQLATGPSAAFDFNDIQDSPAINRDIKDIVRQDPRLFIDQSNDDGLQCAGASPRFNSLTVDGIRLNDNFGLNANGFPTERVPFPFDAIDQVAVEFSPFDVEYGGFTACNVNAVTRSGQNEFHGSAWADYTNDSLRGGSIEGDSFDKGDFREVRFGATLSGPIIKDKLFFFAAYENLNGNEVISRGPAEAGSIGVPGVTQAQLDRIAQVARDVYGYDVLDIPASFPESDEKILAKLDWNITDDHRATFTFNRNNGNNITASDNDPDEYEFFDHFYLRSTKLTSYSGQVFSSWTDRLSTEVRVSYTTNDTGQNSINGTDFGEFQIDTYNPATDQTATVYLGADDSRHSNKLDTDTFNAKFKADYVVNNHLLSLGFEREAVEVFNLFVQHSEGQYDFDAFNTGNGLLANPDANIDAFEAQFVDDFFYGNAGGTNNPDDAAANFSFATNSIYAQDKISFDQWGLTVTAGVRYDFYTSGDVPTENVNFAARNGFSNTATFDGRGLLQPRLGINYEATDRLTFRAGVGIFSGGNPNVWLANSYQNDGITTIQLELDDTDLTSLTFVEGENGQNTPGFGVPESLFNAVASGTADTAVNAVDPDFDIPSQWKVSGGFTYDFDMPLGLGEGLSFRADYQFTKDRRAATIIDSTVTQVGTASDGRPLFRRVDFSDPDCATNPGDEMLCDGRDGANQDFILTNNDGGRSHIFSGSLSNDFEFDNGVYGDWTLGYAYVDATDRNPMTSSVAFSNFTNFATSNVNNPAAATSNYVVPHRFTLTAGLSKAFFSDYETKFRLFGTVSQSRPFSFVFNDNFGFHQRLGDRGFIERQLIYVPTGASDPNVTFSDDFNGATTPAERDAQIAAFFAKLDELGISEGAGGISPRNGFQSDWFSQWDLRIEQEIPGLFNDDKGSFFVVIENIGNLLNDEWGVINQAGFPGAVRLIDADLNGDQLVYEGFRDVTREDILAPVTDSSVWEIRFGVRYTF